MTGIVSVPYNARVLNDTRRQHDAWVAKQADRLGVEPSAILAAVRRFGLTAADVSELTDKAGLSRYVNGLTILGHQPIACRPFTARRPVAARPVVQIKPTAKTVRHGNPARQTDKRVSSKWPRDHGVTSLGQALKRVGFK